MLGQPWQVWTDHPLSLLPFFSPTTSTPGQRTSGLQAQLTDCGPGYGSTSWGPSGGSGVPVARRRGVSEGDSRVLVLQRDNFPLAWREGSTGVPEGGSRVLLLQRDNFPLAWREGSTGV